MTKKIKKNIRAFGGKLIDMDTPQESINEMIRLSEEASLESMSDPTVMGLQVLGSALTNTGMSMASTGLSQAAGAGKGNKVTDFLSKNMGALKALLNGTQIAGSIRANGGELKDLRPTEIEGNELVELPDGEVFKAKGPSHEKGGIPALLPTGTKISSDQVKINGETAAKRREKFLKRISRLEKLLAENPHDKNLKNTLEMARQKTEELNERDMEIQNVLHEAQNRMQQRALGGEIDDTEEEDEDNAFLEYLLSGLSDAEDSEEELLEEDLEEEDDFYDEDPEEDFEEDEEDEEDYFALGGIVKSFPTGGTVKGDKLYNGLNSTLIKGNLQGILRSLGLDLDYDDPNSVRALQKIVGVTTDGKFGKDSYKGVQDYMAKNNIGPYINTPAVTPPGAPDLDATTPLEQPSNSINDLFSTLEIGSPLSSEQAAVANSSITGRTPLDTVEDSDEKPSFLESISDSLGGYSVGDIIGMGAGLMGGYQARKNTLANRAGDTPNINPYKDFGQEALESVDAAMQGLEYSRDRELQDINLDRTGALNRNNRSTRSINTQRALNAMVDSASSSAKGKAHSKFGSQISEMLLRKAQLQNQKDQMVGQGEYLRDTNDRKDRDAFYTQLGEDNQSITTGYQNLGKSLNAGLTREMTAELLSSLSEYFGVDVSAKGFKIGNKKKK